MKMIFYSHANKTNFHEKVFFPSILYKNYCNTCERLKFCENNAKKWQLLTNNTMVMCCEKKMARTRSSMTRQLFDVNDVHQLLKRTVVVFYY